MRWLVVCDVCLAELLWVIDGRWKSAVNMMNPMGSKGQLAFAFANILRDMWQGENQCLTPLPFRVRL